MSIKNTVVSEDQLAKHWGVSTRYVRNLADEDVAVRCSSGYDLLESDRRLIAWMRRDEPMQRLKREGIKATIQQREQKMQIEQRKLLQPSEIRKYIEQAWSVLWLAHTAALNVWYSELAGVTDTDTARVRVHRMETDIKGALRQAQASLEDLYGVQLATMDNELRNGILVNSREIGRLRAALCESDDE